MVDGRHCSSNSESLVVAEDDVDVVWGFTVEDFPCMDNSVPLPSPLQGEYLQFSEPFPV